MPEDLPRLQSDEFRLAWAPFKEDGKLLRGIVGVRGEIHVFTNRNEEGIIFAHKMKEEATATLMRHWRDLRRRSGYTKPDLQVPTVKKENMEKKGSGALYSMVAIISSVPTENPMGWFRLEDLDSDVRSSLNI